MDLHFFSHALLLLIIVVAIVIDWRTTKIPNWLTFSAAICGIIINFSIGSWHGALMSLLGWLLGAVLTVILGNLPIGTTSSSGGIGMGDAKLLAAVGAFLGPKSAIMAVFYFCLFFGLQSCLVLATKVPWKQVGTLVSTAIFEGDISNVKLDTAKFSEQRKSAIPISLAILIATMVTILFKHQTLHIFGLS
jgi:prepilin peptidase CpaA